MRCCQCKSSLQQHCKYLHHNTTCAHCAAALAVQMLAHSPAITAQSTADDLASLLCSLLCYTLTSLLCTSCSFLQHAAQRHSRAILPVRHAIAKRLRARVPLRHRAPFATYMAHASRPWAPSTRRSLDDHDRQRLRHLPTTPSSRPSSSTRSRRAPCIRVHGPLPRFPSLLGPSTTRTPADRPRHQQLAPRRPQRLASCSASAR